jgi:tetratricopeptide (TPR) repeat protein
MTILRLLPVLLLVACATRSAIEESRASARLGDYNRAFVVLDDMRRQQLADGGEIDAELAAAHRQAWMAFLLHRAEERIFQEREDAALADLAELEGLQADYHGIQGLRDRAKLKKARRIIGRGEDSLVRKDYAQALACFLESEAIVPGLEDAAKGIKAVREATDRLTQRGQEQFLEAVRKLPEFRFIEVQWHASNVINNTPDRDEAKSLEDKARRENAQQAMARGKACETEGRFGAALLEYKAAKLLDPGVPGVEAAIAAMTKEQKAAVLIEKAQIDMRAGRFDAAREHLGEAFELSLMARNDIGALVLETKRLEGERRYQEARDLEVLGKKAEALAAFEALAKNWPDGYSDEKARIDSLRVDLEGAQKEWAEAEAAEAAKDLPKALEHYENSERYYPKWKDGKQRIERLRAAIAQAAGGGQGND